MKINIRNPFLVALLGFIFTVADATYVIQPSGAAVEVVQNDAGEWHPRSSFVEGADGDLLPRSEAVEVQGQWYLPDDERLVHVPAYGDCYLLLEDCEEVHGTWHLRSNCVMVDDEWELRSDCVETYDGTWALAEDCVEVFSNTYYRRYDSGEWYSEAQCQEALDNGDIQYVPYRGRYYESQYVVWAVDEDEWELQDDCTEFEGAWYTNRGDRVGSDGRGDAFLFDRYGNAPGYHYCDDGEYWPEDECHYCSAADDWVHGDEDECSCNECLDQDQADHINTYHQTPDPCYYAGHSGWLVGFEVEKCAVKGCDDAGDYVGASDLFAGWEKDSSCGVEGITHCYDPCCKATMRRFLRHLHSSEAYVNAPSDSDCGGHINLSRSGFSSYELRDMFRPYAPLWYAVYRGRLNNSYCCNDKLIKHGGEKYSVVHRKPFGIEIRLPHAVKSDVVLRNRFHLVHLTCRAIENNLTFAAYVRSCKPFLLHHCYGGDTAKLRKVLSLAGHFHKWFATNGTKVHGSIRQYV